MHPWHSHGYRMRVVARDGHPLGSAAFDCDTLGVNPGERWDVIDQGGPPRRLGVPLPHPAARRGRRRDVRHGQHADRRAREGARRRHPRPPCWPRQPARPMTVMAPRSRRGSRPPRRQSPRPQPNQRARASCCSPPTSARPSTSATEEAFELARRLGALAARGVGDRPGVASPARRAIRDPHPTRSASVASSSPSRWWSGAARWARPSPSSSGPEDPGDMIVEAAEAEHVDMIVVGSHGRGAVGPLLHRQRLGARRPARALPRAGVRPLETAPH